MLALGRWRLLAYVLGAALYGSVGVGIVIDVLDHASREHSTVTWVLMIPAVTLIAKMPAVVRTRGPYRVAAASAIVALCFWALYRSSWMV